MLESGIPERCSGSINTLVGNVKLDLAYLKLTGLTTGNHLNS